MLQKYLTRKDLIFKVDASAKFQSAKGLIKILFSVKAYKTSCKTRMKYKYYITHTPHLSCTKKKYVWY